MKIEKVRDRVKQIMIKHPNMRDNYHSLIAEIWRQDAHRIGINMNSVTIFLMNLSAGKLTNYRSVIRAWAKIQEENPHLRGESYLERTGRIEKEVRDEIRNW